MFFRLIKKVRIREDFNSLKVVFNDYSENYHFAPTESNIVGLVRTNDDIIVQQLMENGNLNTFPLTNADYKIISEIDTVLVQKKKEYISKLYQK